MQGRRGFEKAITIGAKSGANLGVVGVEFYKIIYDFEEEIKDKSFEEKYNLRNEKMKPVWNEFKQRADENHKKVVHPVPHPARALPPQIEAAFVVDDLTRSPPAPAVPVK